MKFVLDLTIQNRHGVLMSWVTDNSNTDNQQRCRNCLLYNHSNENCYREINMTCQLVTDGSPSQIIIEYTFNGEKAKFPAINSLLKIVHLQYQSDITHKVILYNQSNDIRK